MTPYVYRRHRQSRHRRGHSGRRSTSQKPNHRVIAVVIVLSCLLVIAFLIYDLVFIYHFFSDLQTTLSDDTRHQQTGTTTEQQSEEEDAKKLLKKIELYGRQRALAAALIVVMMLQLLSGIAVYVGFEKKIKRMLVGYLVLTFPAMTFAVIHAILFMVYESSTYLYVKIVSVILVYTVQANIFRVVYKMYRWLKHQSRRGHRQQGHHSAESDNRNHDHLPPVHIQLKPPPYEKEPPPYDLKPPEINPSGSHPDPPSPTSHSSHMTETPTDISMVTGDTDSHFLPSVHAPHTERQSRTDSCPPGEGVRTRLGVLRMNYDVPPSVTAASVFHIETVEEGLPPPYSET